MSGNPGSPRTEGAKDHSQSDTDIDSSLSEGYKSPSPFLKPVKKAAKALKAP